MSLAPAGAPGLNEQRSAEATATPGSEVELFSLAGRDGHLREVNEAFARLLGFTLEHMNGRSLLELVHPDDIANIVAGLAALDAGAAEVLLENRFMRHDGTAVHLQWVARPVAGTDLWWAAGRDTTEFHRLLGQREDLRTRLTLALGQATAAMWDLDLRNDRFTWEPQAADVLVVPVDALPTTAAELVALINDEDADGLRQALSRLAESGATEIALRTGDGPDLRHLSLRGKVLERDRRGHPLRAVGLLVDVTAEKAMEEQMLRMVMSDSLTGVPNRRSFDHTLRNEFKRCARALQPMSVLMIDIDDFKRLNDSYGHLIGDQSLIAVARALTAGLQRAGDTVARFGGEEFAVALPDTDAPGAMSVGERLLDAVRSVAVRQAAEWRPSVSIGVATWEPGSPAGKPADLLAHADAALYQAKRAGKDRAVAYTAARHPEPAAR